MYRPLHKQETATVLALPAIQLDTQANPDSAIIWLHGLGANGHDFEPVVEQLNLPASTRARFIFPHAPSQAVSLNNAMHMPAWYNLYGLDMDSEEDAKGIQKIKVEIDALIDQQVGAGIQAHRIVLAGFSQGGALSLYAGLSHARRLAGLLAMSCYLPLRHELPGYAKHADRSLPIFLAHGIYDEVVALAFAQLARELLEAQGFDVYWKEYPCAHTVCAQQITDIRSWLLQCWQ